MRTVISAAGLNIGIDHYLLFSDWLDPFLTSEEPDFTVSSTLAEIQAERALSQRTPNYSEFVCAYRKIAERLPDYDAFVMHGAVVCRGDEAFLITAPSGTGKTTHVELWLRSFPDAWILNGDKPILRIMNGCFYACGTPWRGKENYGVPGMVPLKAISMLHRGIVNEIYPENGKDMISFLMKQVYLPKDPYRRLKQLDLMNELLLSVPSYSLHCNMDPSAARLSFDTMSSAVLPFDLSSIS